ncbi:MAG TPA: hypothetical protein VHM70_18575 [Polyangiaceae bacterium]|nr:hypothetical protein [Polyangiaceae bacterium]
MLLIIAPNRDDHASLLSEVESAHLAHSMHGVAAACPAARGVFWGTTKGGQEP